MNTNNTYKCRLVAKNFPKMQEGVLDKITVSNGFSLKEVREYKGKLRAMALDSLNNSDNLTRLDSLVSLDSLVRFNDCNTLGCLMYWEKTEEGREYWHSLSMRLHSVSCTKSAD